MVTESRLVEHKEWTLTIRCRQQGDSNKMTVATCVDLCRQLTTEGRQQGNGGKVTRQLCDIITIATHGEDDNVASQHIGYAMQHTQKNVPEGVLCLRT